jgi:hypothetical protein
LQNPLKNPKLRKNLKLFPSISYPY